MKKPRSSIDGFIPRRFGNELGDLGRLNTTESDKDNVQRNLNISGEKPERELGRQNMGQSVGRSDIDESLRDIDNSAEPEKKLSRRQRRRINKLSKKPRSKSRRFIKWFLIIVTVAILAVGGFALYKFIAAGNNIFQGNIFGLFQNQPLKQDSNGRSNFLILGTSEDDPGHQGSNLTDSMLVVSIDQKNKDVYMFSMPRDMVVEYGEACVAGYSGKVNAYFSCANTGDSASAEQDRLTKTQKLVGDIFGLDIQYGVHVNYTVMRDIVNAIGGSIDVKIESRDPRGQMDANFDWKCGATYAKRLKNCPPNGHFIDYPNGPVTLDAEHALYLAQARGDAENYGFELSNFDREKNQQKILVAIKDKAMSAGVLTNIGAVTSLMDTLGSNLRTNIDTSEIRTVMQVFSEVKSSSIHSLDLYGAGVIAGNGNPAAGEFDYSAIQAYVKKSLSSDAVTREAAPITVLNGTGQSGYGQSKADILTGDGFNVTAVDTAPDGTYDNVEIYQIGKGNTGTAAKLAKIFNVTIKKTAPPVTVNGETKFVIIFGAATT
jgi:anionic cell wall polymer biosynthesis LytR-Cps2A-Psr (LCP) family protein